MDYKERAQEYLEEYKRVITDEDEVSDLLAQIADDDLAILEEIIKMAIKNDN